MQNEAVHALFKNYSKENGMDIRFLGTGDGARYFADFLQTASYYVGDAPDMLLKKEMKQLLLSILNLIVTLSAGREARGGRKWLESKGVNLPGKPSRIMRSFLMR